MEIVWSIVLRTGQTVIEASSTLLVGILVAAVMRRMLGAAGTRRLFGGTGWRGLFRAWGVGMLLPVCSLGVIPIAREMRRAGVPGGTILAFVLAAPHINPLSLLYGLTLSEPVVIISFAAASLIIALAAGALWDRVFARDTDAIASGEEPMPAPGPRRLAAVAITAAREAVGPAMPPVLAGILFTGLIAGLLPHGCLGMTMRHSDPLSPALMTALALPLHSGPLQGMMRLGLIFEHGNSVGAAFMLFELGIGLNIGLIAWLMFVFGARRVLTWLAIIVAMAVGIGYAMEYPLYFAREEASHTHAFDEWTSPFPAGVAVEWGLVRAKLLQKIEVLEPLALGGLALLLLSGPILRLADRQGRLENWLVRRGPESSAGARGLNREVPGAVLGLISLAGLVVFSVVALFIYYPAPREAFADIVTARVEALTAARSGNKEEAIRQLERWDLLTRKLQVGVFIRGSRPDPEKTAIVEDLRERIEDLRDALLAGDQSQVLELIPVVEAAYRKCRDALAMNE